MAEQGKTNWQAEMAERQEKSEAGKELPQLFRPQPVSGLPQLAAPPPPPPEEETFSFAQYLEVLSRRRWLALAVAVTFLLLAALQVFTTTPLYRATATLQIDPEFSNIVPFENIGDPSGRMPSEASLMTQVTKLRSRGLAEGVIRELGLADDPLFSKPVRRGFFIDQANRLKRLVKGLFKDGSAGSERSAGSSGLTYRLLNGLSATTVRSTRLINVSFTSPDPDMAAKVVNGTVGEFVRQNLSSKYESMSKVTEFLERELTGLGSRIESSEAASRDFAREQNIVTLSEQQEVNRSKLNDLVDARTQVETELVAQRPRYQAALNARLDGFPELLKNEAIRALEARSGTMEAELASLSGRYGPEWPQVKELNLQLASLALQAGEAKQKAIDRALQEYQLLRRRQQEFGLAVEQQRRVVDDINDELVQYNMLQREVDSNKEVYEGLLQRLSQAGVAVGLKSNDMRVVEQAIRPSSIHSPNKTQALGLSLVLGLALGLAAAFAAESLDRSLKTAEDVNRHLRLPALGVIPDLSGENGRRGWGFPKRRQQSQAGIPVLVRGELSAREAAAWESYRSLRTAVLLSHSGKPPQTILVTSAAPGEGKTTTVANLAIALAQTGARTLMLDLDLRRPSLADEFEVPGDQGMSTFLSGNSDLSTQIRTTSYANLFLVPAGPVAPNPAELLGSERMATGLQLVREYFKYVVIDAPPALNLSDALVLSPRVEGVILVARAGKTPREAVRKVGDQLRSVGAAVLGVVVNDGEVDRDAYGSLERYYGSEA